MIFYSKVIEHSDDKFLISYVFLELSIANIYRQFLGCIPKVNRLIEIHDTGVRPETLDDQAAGCSTEPTGFFKIPPHGESHDEAGTIRIATTSGVNHNLLFVGSN